MNLTKVNCLVQRLARSRMASYLLCFILLLLVAGGGMASTGCLYVYWWGGIPLLGIGCSSISTAGRTIAKRYLPDTADVMAQGRYAEVWLEFGATGIFTPTTTARGLSLSTPYGETPPIEDELAEKGYIAIRVPHAPPTYTASSLLPGIPPSNPDAVIFSYYMPPDSATLTTIPVSVTRRFDYEPIVNARFPIPDNQSHWEVWWLPEGKGFPIPDQPFRLDKDSWPPPLGLRFRIDFVDADAFACAGCPVEALFYNGYVFIGPYRSVMRFTYPSIPREPLVTFGAHCGYESEALFPTVGQYITPTAPFTHVHCLENWDTATRTFTITTASSQGWDYTYYYQTTETGAKPVPVAGVPFTVAVGPPPDSWSPGLLGLLAVHTPTITVTDTMRETFQITATSVISPDVWANTVSFALAPGYQLNEGKLGSTLYLPLVVRNAKQ